MTAVLDLPTISATKRADLAAWLRPRVPLPLPEWAEQHRWLAGPLVGTLDAPVRWSNDFDALCRAQLDALASERWTAYIEMASPQAAGKTERMTTLLCWWLAELRRDAFYFSAAAPLAHTQWHKKFKPALETSPSLRHLLPQDREEGGVKDRRELANGTTLYLAGAESRGALAGVTAGLVVGDDVQGMIPFAQGDHPVDVATERSGALPGHRARLVLLGQPGAVDDYLARALFRSAFYMPFVPCLECGTYQLIEWDRMVYDAEDPVAALRATRLRCCNTDCGHEAEPADLRAMLRQHRWVSTPPGENWVTRPMAGGTWVDLRDHAVYPETSRKTTEAGFWRSALYWPWKTWGEHAVRAIAAAGQPEAALNFAKAICARPQEPPRDTSAMEPDEIAAHARDGQRYGTVPDWADLVILTSDVQGGYVYYLARAWRRGNGESRLVTLGSTKELHKTSGLPGGLEVLGKLVADGWPLGGGPRAGELVYPTLCLIDSRYQPDVVWRHCVRYGLARWRPLMGMPDAKAIWPGRPTEKQGRRFWPVAVNEAKTVLWKTLQITPGQPGYHGLPADVPEASLRAYTRHMTSEVYDEGLRRWVKRKDWSRRRGQAAERVGRNDYWDCEVYQIAGAIACGVHLPAFDMEAPPRPAAPVAAPSGDGERPRALQRRGPIRRRY
jgi:phage terminase large subunit GpA-like protein